MSKTFASSALALLAALAGPADAYWRMECPGTLFTGRIDPIVNPGAVSGHTHIVLGGNGFAPTMDFASTQKSTCTTCTIKGDLSNYWVPALYYQKQGGGFESVPLAGGQGGTVYYQQRSTYKGNTTITAFPDGFRMLAGSPNNRAVSQTNTTQQAVSFACLDYSGRLKYPEGELFPTVACPDGLRAQVYFPQCWDGKTLDPEGHKSHMAYPSGYNGGECPDSHPVPVMGLFYEFLFDTPSFPFWTPAGATQPFVWAMGDTTGRGFHGDFINGWDHAILQNGINKKTSADAGCAGNVLCNGIFQYPDLFGTECSLPGLVDEQVEGNLTALPGCNKPSADASDTATATCSATTQLKVVNSVAFTDVTAQNWQFLGCGNDTASGGALSKKIADSPTMTVESCVKQCGAAGFSYAGLEFATQCFCGSSLPASAKPATDTLGDCHMACAGNAKQTCGGPKRLSLYQACSGGACKNAFVGFVGSIGTLGSGASAPASNSSSGGSGSAPMPSVSAAPMSSMPAAASSAAASVSQKAVAAPVSDVKQAPSATASASVSKKVAIVPVSDIKQAPSASAAPAYPSSAAPAYPSAPSAYEPTMPMSTGAAMAPSPPSNSSSSSTGLPDGWAAMGCYTDSLSKRALNGINLAWWGAPITTAGCATYCSAKGFSMAGTEFGKQCYCGNELEGGSAKAADADACNMPCAGDAKQMCGGKQKLTLVAKGAGSAGKRRSVHARRHANGMMKH